MKNPEKMGGYSTMEKGSIGEHEESEIHKGRAGQWPSKLKGT